MHCEVILFYFTLTTTTTFNADICLRFLPPSSTGTIARVRVSTYVGGVHEDLTSLSPNPGDASEVAVGRPISAAHTGQCYSSCLRGSPPWRPPCPPVQSADLAPLLANHGGDERISRCNRPMRRRVVRERSPSHLRRKCGCLDQRVKRRCARGRSVGQRIIVWGVLAGTRKVSSQGRLFALKRSRRMPEERVGARRCPPYPVLAAAWSCGFESL